MGKTTMCSARCWPVAFCGAARRSAAFFGLALSGLSTDDRNELRSPPPYRWATRWTLGWALAGRRPLWSPIIVSTSSCAPDAYSAFPPRHRSQSVSQSVRGREGRVGSTPPGGARQGPIAGYVLQSAAPAGPSPWVKGLQGRRHHRQYTAHSGTA